MSLAKNDTKRDIVLLIVVFSALIGFYLVVRYDKLWTETDTSTITRAIDAIQTEGTLIPTKSVYPHGFTYQAVTVWISTFTGIPIRDLQVTVWPLLSGVGLCITAYAFYKLTLSSQKAALAVLFLLLQADILFVILRGSHEKLDWPLMLLALLCVVRSTDTSVRNATKYVLLTYFVLFAMFTVNQFFATTLMLALLFSLLYIFVFTLVVERKLVFQTSMRKLVYIVVISLILVYLFMVYVYPPAFNNLYELSLINENLWTFLGGDRAGAQPYGYVSVGWTSLTVYLALTIFTWSLIMFSFITWLVKGYRMVQDKHALNLRTDFIWLLYAGFATQVALGILIDLTGSLAGNLQLRIFPGFTILAVALLAESVQRFFDLKLQNRWLRIAKLSSQFAVVVFIMWFSIAAIVKSTSEPLVSNKWGFYSPTEVAAIDWSFLYLPGASLWMGPDDRLGEAFRFRYSALADQGFEIARSGAVKAGYILYSESDVMSSYRVLSPMPDVYSYNRVFDVGTVYVYKRQPQTQFQR